MPVRQIGRKAYFHGKTLYEILRNFKNYGVGRMVMRYEFNRRYPEPSYYILTKVEPDMTCSKLGNGNAYGKYVFRGEEFGERKINAGGRADWRLVPKEEEAEIIKRAQSCPPRPKNLIDPVLKLPPLMEDLLRQEMKDSGEDYTKPLVAKRKIKKSFTNRAVLGSY